MDFYFGYSVLSQSIKDILLAHSYDDITNPGKDDKADDYFEIFYSGDLYLRDCIEKGFKQDNKTKFSNKFRTVIHAHYDPNSTARTPKNAYSFPSDLFDLRLWLVEIATKNYNVDEHLNYLRNSAEYKSTSQSFKLSSVKLSYEYNDHYSFYPIQYEFILGDKLVKNKLNVAAEKLDEHKIKTIIKHLEIEKLHSAIEL
jgi:hypothetical protein